MNNFYIYLEKVLKEKEIINEKMTSTTEETFYNKIFLIKQNYVLLMKIKEIEKNGKKLSKELLELKNNKKYKSEIIKIYRQTRNFLKKNGLNIDLLDKDGIQKLLKNNNTNFIGNNYNASNFFKFRNFNNEIFKEINSTRINDNLNKKNNNIINNNLN
jgi:hypothetical protein